MPTNRQDFPTFRCCECGSVLDRGEIELFTENDTPGACISHLRTVRQEALKKIAVWPDDWHGGWIRGQSNPRWVYTDGTHSRI